MPIEYHHDCPLYVRSGSFEGVTRTMKEVRNSWCNVILSILCYSNNAFDLHISDLCVPLCFYIHIGSNSFIVLETAGYHLLEYILSKQSTSINPEHLNAEVAHLSRSIRFFTILHECDLEGSRSPSPSLNDAREIYRRSTFMLPSTRYHHGNV